METETERVRVIPSGRQSVESRFLPNTRRIKVTASSGVMKSYVWDDRYEVAENHAGAIQQFLTFMEWTGTYSIGSSVSGRGYVAVWVGE